MDGYQNILVAADFSVAGENAVEKTGTLAGRFGASLTILHVIEHFPEDMPVGVIPPEDVDPQKYITDHARSSLEKLSARIGQSGAALEVVVSTHSASREIVRYAQGHGFDLIVVGSHGKDGIKEMSGSTANSVVQAASIDVLVVHPTE
jgi:nucleotide-binding universal stress UspA family protein